nr:probable WRKY transcription factor 50 [Ipomoea batatas]
MLTSLGDCSAPMDGNNHHHHYYYTTLHNDDSTFARQDSGFELSEFFDLDVWPPEEDPVFAVAGHPQNPGQTTAVDAVMVPSGGGGVTYAGPSSSITDSGGGMERTAAGVTERFAFKTKSDIEILDDGYKWRKYGKKKVKNSPNPRNYYRCSVNGCPVKKRVERDKEDPSYVITTYVGIHNHQGP